VKPLKHIDLSEMDRNRISSLTHGGPVALVEGQQVAGVLLSPAQWQAITQTLEAAQECLAVMEITTRANTG
jgi:hypothetical protein